MRVRNRRSLLNYSIKRNEQIRILLKVLSIVMIGVGLMAIIFYFYSNKEVSSNYRQFHIDAQNFLDWLLVPIILSLLAAFLVAIAISIFLPHTFVGALFRIERDLKEKVGEGDLTMKFILRKGDEHKALAEAINDTVEKLRHKVEKIKIPAEELETYITGMKEKGDSEVERLVKKINEAVREFKL